VVGRATADRALRHAQRLRSRVPEPARAGDEPAARPHRSRGHRRATLSARTGVSDLGGVSCCVSRSVECTRDGGRGGGGVSPRVWPVLTMVALLLGWEALVRLADIPAYTLPAPSLVA